jgi:ATP-dependent DNA helicase Q1
VLADAVQPTDEWDDLKGIETQASVDLNDMMVKGVPQCEGGVAKGSSRNHAPDDLEDFDLCSDDYSDFEMDNHRTLLSA